MNRVSKRDDGDDSGDVDADRAALEASLSDEHTKTVVLRDTSVAPHDFSLTPNHYVIVENRLGGDTLPYILGTKRRVCEPRATSSCSCNLYLDYLDLEGGGQEAAILSPVALLFTVSPLGRLLA